MADGLYEQAFTETNLFDAEADPADAPSKSCKNRQVWGVFKLAWDFAYSY